MILVTGGAGFIGSNFVIDWRKAVPQEGVVNLDALTYAGNLENLQALEGDALHHFVKGDITDRALVRVFNDRGSYHCAAHVSGRARPGVVNGLGIWWRKLGVRGTNVNELTSQQLTDMGRAPVFYDCLVQVEPA